MTQAIAEAGINLRGLSAAAVGKRFVACLVLDTRCGRHQSCPYLGNWFKGGKPDGTEGGGTNPGIVHCAGGFGGSAPPGEAGPAEAPGYPTA